MLSHPALHKRLESLERNMRENSWRISWDRGGVHTHTR